MMETRETNKNDDKVFFHSMHTLRQRWKDGSFGEILDDWRWIFTYTRRHRAAVVFYTVLGILSTTLGLVASVAGKYLIDIITGYQTDKLGLLIAIMLGSAGFSLLFSSLINRLSTRISIRINNDIQADIFDQIIDVDWKAISAYSSGDLLNRFNNDVQTVSKNAISWLPSIIIAAYNFVVTFALIWHYNKVMSLLAFVSAPVMLLMSKYFITKQRSYARQVKETGSEMMGFEVETFYNFDTIKSFGVMENYGKKLRRWQQKLKKISLDYNMFTIKTNVFLSVLGMIVQYAAASMVSENKVLAHPASVDSIPSSANQEDIVSMGTTAARKAHEIVQNTLSVLALELLTACQAIDIRRQLNTHGQGISLFHQKVYDRVRSEIPFYDVDRELWPDIRKAEAFIRRKDLLDLIDEYMPEMLENNAWEQYRGE